MGIQFNPSSQSLNLPTSDRNDVEFPSMPTLPDPVKKAPSRQASFSQSGRSTPPPSYSNNFPIGRQSKSSSSLTATQYQSPSQMMARHQSENQTSTAKKIGQSLVYGPLSGLGFGTLGAVALGAVGGVACGMPAVCTGHALIGGYITAGFAGTGGLLGGTAGTVAGCLSPWNNGETLECLGNTTDHLVDTLPK